MKPRKAAPGALRRQREPDVIYWLIHDELRKELGKDKNILKRTTYRHGEQIGENLRNSTKAKGFA